MKISNLVLLILILNYRSFSQVHLYNDFFNNYIFNNDTVAKKLLINDCLSDQIIIFVYGDDKAYIDSLIKNKSILLKNKQTKIPKQLTSIIYKNNNKLYFQLITDSVIYKKIPIRHNYEIDYGNSGNSKKNSGNPKKNSKKNSATADDNVMVYGTNSMTVDDFIEIS